MKKYHIVIETKRIDINGYYYLIIPNVAAGYKGRYTVYRIPSSDGGRIKIVGRELTLGFAKRYVNNLIRNNGKYIKEEM